MKWNWLKKFNLAKYFKMRSKTPWGSFTFNGFIEDGIVPIEFDYNDAFITHLRELGFSGINEEETVRHFLISLVMPKSMEDDMVSSDSHPDLTSDMNELKR